MTKKENTIEYEVIRSGRRTLAVQVEKGKVIVRAPNKASQTAIDEAVEEKRDWVLKNLAEQKEVLRKRAEFVLDYGDQVRLLGKEYPMVQTSAEPSFDGRVFHIPADKDQSQIKNLMVQVYREVAEQWLTARTMRYANAMGIEPSGIGVTSARKRWGSCSGEDRINYSWRLILAPVEAIDYVIVHELAHLIHPNHSREFWDLVEQILPDYAERQELLEEIELELQAEGW